MNRKGGEGIQNFVCLFNFLIVRNGSFSLVGKHLSINFKHSNFCDDKNNHTASREVSP
jgi:hypothetical protein